jgi:hypothetical protein
LIASHVHARIPKYIKRLLRVTKPGGWTPSRLMVTRKQNIMQKSK